VVIGESTAGSTTDTRGVVGTIRWMAPELMYPEGFGFVSEYRKRLPSRSTDTYALGMTILEVRLLAPPFASIRILDDPVYRLSPGAIHSAMSPGT